MDFIMIRSDIDCGFYLTILLCLTTLPPPWSSTASRMSSYSRVFGAFTLPSQTHYRDNRLRKKSIIFLLYSCVQGAVTDESYDIITQSHRLPKNIYAWPIFYNIKKNINIHITGIFYEFLYNTSLYSYTGRQIDVFLMHWIPAGERHDNNIMYCVLNLLILWIKRMQLRPRSFLPRRRKKNIIGE